MIKSGVIDTVSTTEQNTLSEVRYLLSCYVVWSYRWFPRNVINHMQDNTGYHNRQRTC